MMPATEKELRARLDNLIAHRDLVQSQIDEVNDQLEEIRLNGKKQPCPFVHLNVSGGCSYPSCTRKASDVCMNPACLLYKNPNPVMAWGRS